MPAIKTQPGKQVRFIFCHIWCHPLAFQSGMNLFGLPRSTVSEVVNELQRRPWRFAVALPTASVSTGRFQMPQRRIAGGFCRMQPVRIRLNRPDDTYEKQ
jgi:hypothetical protein